MYPKITPVNDIEDFSNRSFEVGQTVVLDGFSEEFNKEFRIHAFSKNKPTSADLWLVPKKGKKHIYKSYLTMDKDVITVSEPSLIHKSGSKY